MKKAGAFCLGLLVAGCATPPRPVVIPAPADITNSAAAIDVVPVKPVLYLSIGYALNYRRCLAYFDELVAQQGQAGQFNMLGGAAAAGAGLAGASPAGIAGIAAASALLSGMHVNAATGPLGGSLPVTAYGLWRKAHQAFVEAAPVPMTPEDADLLVTADAALCTPVGIQLLAQDALAAAQPVAVSRATTLLYLSPAQPRAAAVPPLVEVPRR